VVTAVAEVLGCKRVYPDDSQLSNMPITISASLKLSPRKNFGL
jgi:hypothetical protein